MPGLLSFAFPLAFPFALLRIAAALILTFALSRVPAALILTFAFALVVWHALVLHCVSPNAGDKSEERRSRHRVYFLHVD